MVCSEVVTYEIANKTIVDKPYGFKLCLFGGFFYLKKFVLFMFVSQCVRFSLKIICLDFNHYLIMLNASTYFMDTPV